jgi:hypothetical protein
MARCMAHRSYGQHRHAALWRVVLERSSEPCPTVKWVFMRCLLAWHRQEHHMASGNVRETKKHDRSKALYERQRS